MISEERLRTAARAVSQAMIDSLPEPEDCHHDFSPEFERKSSSAGAATGGFIRV